MIESELDKALIAKGNLTQKDVDEIEAIVRNKIGSKPTAPIKALAATNTNIELPSIKKDAVLDTIDTRSPRQLRLKNELSTVRVNGTSKTHKIKDGNLRTMDNTPRHNHSTLAPSIYNKHKDLLTSNDNLSGLTDQNEWDEIWKYAKIKEQEEESSKYHKKLAERIKFNNDLKEQINQNRLRKKQAKVLPQAFR